MYLFAQELLPTPQASGIWETSLKNTEKIKRGNERHLHYRSQPRASLPAALLLMGQKHRPHAGAGEKWCTSDPPWP